MRATILTMCGLLLAGVAGADESGWPREVQHPRAMVVMYQPQIEEATANDIEARAAVSVTWKDQEQPHFGAVWMEARVEVDRDLRTVTFTDIEVTEVRFPGAEEVQIDELVRLLEYEMKRWELVDSLDRYLVGLETAEQEKPETGGLRNDPPKILVSTEPAVLVLIDGAPRLRPVEEPKKAVKKKVERVVNTPFLIVLYPKEELFYLHGGGNLWYVSAELETGWAPTDDVPKAVLAMVEEEDDGDDEEVKGRPPAIVVATEPTELVVLNGSAQYAPLDDLNLLYVANTDNDILMETHLQRHFLLLSGRWFTSTSLLEGAWTFVVPDQLPEAFALIPADSPMGHLLPHIPGTAEAREAVLDSTIPQTAAIRRDDTSLEVEYDGQPQFQPVDGTTVSYASNSPQSVFKLGSTYYCCEQAVWYESQAPTGPWKVSVEVPDAIYDIPASNPHHNVTYVRVYDVTPQTVYVGYTPGYAGSYVYGGTVVYGTGWYYPGWYGSVYYPRSSTWGFHASYNPWGGWGFGLSYSTGPFTFSLGHYGWGHPYRRGWWGPCGYNPWHRPGYGYRPGYHPRPPYYRPPGHPGYPSGPARPPGNTRPPASGGGSAVTRPSAGGAQARPATAEAAGTRQNLYARDSNATRNAAVPSTSERVRPSAATDRANNVYTDRSGNVMRQTPSGWDQRQGGSWKPSTGSGAGVRPSTPSTGAIRPSNPSTGAIRPSTPSTGAIRPSTPSTGAMRPSAPSTLNRDASARTRGQARTQQYRATPSRSMPQSRPSGARPRRR